MTVRCDEDAESLDKAITNDDFMMGVFAEFERSMISERVKAGLARTKAKGTRLGRPKVSIEREAQILELRTQGMGMLAIGKELGIGTSTVQRVVAERQ